MLARTSALLLGIVSASTALADVSVTLSGPPQIDLLTTQTATFSALVTIAPDVGRSGISLDSLSYQFSSGDGDLYINQLGSGIVGSGNLGTSYGGSLTFSFSASFSYLDPGTYHPSITVFAQTTSFDIGPVTEAYWEPNGYYKVETYQCGFLNMQTCTDTVWVDMTKYVLVGSNVPHNFNYNVYENAATSSTLIATVPEPETYAMLLIGLGLFGGLAKRTKTRQQE